MTTCSTHRRHTKRIQVTVVIRAFAIRVFSYPPFSFGVMRSINILSTATLEDAAQAHRVARAVSLTRLTISTPGTTNFGLSWCITQKIHVSRFTRFRYTRRFAGKQPPRITRVTCTKFYSANVRTVGTPACKWEDNIKIYLK
jgi:hypothetical protein